MNSTTATVLVLGPLMAWRIYKRFRRLIGRQRLSKSRLSVTLVVYTLMTALFGLSASGYPTSLYCLAAGVACGIVLGVIGLKKTRFEPTKEGLFYTPQAHLGIALSLLFIGRIAYRFIVLSTMSAEARHDQNSFQRSPLTLALYGLMAGYYVTYAIGLLRWRHGLIQAKRRREALQAMQAPPPVSPPQ